MAQQHPTMNELIEILLHKRGSDEIHIHFERCDHSSSISFTRKSSEFILSESGLSRESALAHSCTGHTHQMGLPCQVGNPQLLTTIQAGGRGYRAALDHVPPVKGLVPLCYQQRRLVVPVVRRCKINILILIRRSQSTRSCSLVLTTLARPPSSNK